MKTLLTVNPHHVPANSSLIVQRTDICFHDNRYVVITEYGDVVRQGTIADTSRDFALSVGGMAFAHYYFILGEAKERFTVV